MADDIGFDDIFDEFEDPNAEQLEFMGYFQEVIGGVPVKFVTETGESIIPANIESFPPALETAELCEIALGQAGGFVWSAGTATLTAGVFIPALHGTLFCLLSGGELEKSFWEISLQAALKYSLVKLDEQKILVENEQLQRQAAALKQQHNELVENNHRQYLQLQDKEKEYAKKLENEIAKRTAELRKTNEELIQASKLKDEFLANMSHELRTPMNAIIGFSELLAETELSEVQADYAQTIKQSGSGLLSLINDILDFAKIEADKLDIDVVPFSLVEVLKNVCAMFEKPALEKDVDFRFQLDERLPAELIGDGNRLKQVLVNLSGNAMKFTEQGEIEIRADFAGQQGDNVGVEFLVRDTGIGIAPDRQLAIFDKFVQEDGSTTRKFGGTGLGLAISNKLVALMGGRMSVESEVGKGSIFRFSLTLPVAGVNQQSKTEPKMTDMPLAQEKDRQTVAGIADTHVAETKTILLVEDNIVNQKLASVLIKRQGYEVVVAADGLIALEKLKERRFSLVLMDLQMPNMGGLEATKRIREIENSPENADYKGLQDSAHPVPIVGLSAHARKEDAEESLRAGMNDFLTKPIVRAKLEGVLEQIEDS